ncbi:MAG TPA: Hsp33 family molecular chaperone HslO [Blastocatellia bacterium]
MNQIDFSKDKLVHATAADNRVRCVAAVTTGLVGEACGRHGTFPTASVALGRLLTGTLLLGRTLKDLEKITVQFQCDGPIRGIIAQADAVGRVRGYAFNREADATEMNSLGKFDVRSIVGSGTVYVTRDAGFEIGLLKEPYRGSVPIVSGEIGEDLAYYLAKSEQINSAVGVGVLMTVTAAEEEMVSSEVAEFSVDRLRVAASGGYIIQIMPNASPELIDQVERAVTAAPYSTDMIRRGSSPADMLQEVLGELDLCVLEEITPVFHCQCSKQRALQIISCLGNHEIEDMLAKDRGAELICHFCNEAYQISDDELSEMLVTAD